MSGIQLIGIAWVFFLVRQLTERGRRTNGRGVRGHAPPYFFLKTWALETHFPEFKWIIYDISRILSTFIILISLICFLQKNLVRQLPQWKLRHCNFTGDRH